MSKTEEAPGQQETSAMWDASEFTDCADETADHDFLAACRRLSPKLNRVVGHAIAAIRHR